MLFFTQKLSRSSLLSDKVGSWPLQANTLDIRDESENKICKMANSASRLSICLSCINLLGDQNASYDKRLEAAEHISDELNFIADTKLLEQTITTFLTCLERTEPEFISERPRQKLRKLILEMIHRLPAIEALREHYLPIIKLMFRLFEVDNEENVGTVLRIIIELHKAYKPEPIPPEILDFLEAVKNLFSNIKNVYDLNSMFEEKRLVVRELTDETVEDLLATIHTVTNVEVEIPTSPHQHHLPSHKQTSAPTLLTNSINEPTTPGTLGSSSASDICSSSSSQHSTNVQISKQTQTYTLLPRANRSIRVIAELPIIVVLLSQVYNAELQQPLKQLLPLVLETTVLRPPENIRKALKNSDKLDKEIYVEFISAQIKCLSFVAYLVRKYTDTVAKHHPQLTQGLLALLNDCPHEVVSIRKELIAASKYIFQSELRDKFIEHLHTLCNDDILVGTGWTVYETLRPQAYHILVDLLGSYKGRIKLKDLASAINLFAKNLHDNSLPPHVQLMSCKAFNNLVAFTVIPLSDENVEQREIVLIRDLLMRMIEIFVLKFKNIAVFHLPHIKKRIKAQQQAHLQQTKTETMITTQGQANNASQLHSQNLTNKETHSSGAVAGTTESGGRDDRAKFDFSSSSLVQSYNIMECKGAIKSLIIGVKNAIEAIPSYRCPGTGDQMLSPPGAKLFHPKETIVLVRLLKYGLRALDIFTLTPSTLPVPPMGQMNRQLLAQATRGKEEKELLESFASVFTNLHPLIFHEIFSKMIDFVVERTRQNVALLAIVNFIISASSVSPIFSTILSEYLIERMEEIGSNDELSNLYLRMFKMVFASVTLYPFENEQMLKPLLHSIVNKSVELALSAKEPFNYFLLLRALFRSIGGGSHDQLYAEFLPLLPNLLQGLNSFQSGQHKQHMKDLFTELCLTVPVRLSSLMPFMPTLIYPLVSALNGPNQLVSQGLRTLELCVDNLTPDYLYDLLQPVRAELMQGLWKTVRHPADAIAQNCLRVLGKFGGNNRRMLIEPQKLSYIEQKEGSSPHGTTIVVHFPDQKVSINLPIDRAIHIACESLKQVNTNTFYKAHSWELIKGLLVASISNSPDHSQKIKKFFSNPNLASAHIPIRRENIYKCPDIVARSVYKTALVGVMMAASTRELRNSVVSFLNAIVRHHVMLSIGQHLSPQSSEQPQGMDPFVIVDALAVVIGHDDKDLCKSGYYVIVLMIETATILLGSKERACELPLINYLVKTMYELCYTRAWFSKMGGCVSIRFFTDNMPIGWLFRYLTRFVRALLYVMSDLTGELSSGAVDMAQTNLDRLLNVCGKPIVPTNSEETILSQAQAKSLADVTELLIKEITSQNLSVRTRAMKSIELIAQLSNKSAAEIMEPHREVLKTMLPFHANSQDGDKQPVHALEKQPVRTQIGIIHGSTFCTNLEPKVFIIDTNISEHKFYVDQLIRICESDDATLKKLQCYANVTNLAPVRTAALHALASLHYLRDYENLIFKILFKSTESTSLELQEEAYTCIAKFTSKVSLNSTVIQEEVAPILTQLKDSTMWNLQSVKRLMCIAKLFPTIFNDTFCVELQDHLSNISKSAINDLKCPLNANEKVYERTGQANEKIKICAGIIDLLVLVPTVLPATISKLMAMVFKVESSLIMETGSPLRGPLKKFLRRVPEHTISLLLTERNLHEQQVYRLLKFILEGDDGEVFRNVINQQTYYAKLVILTSGSVTVSITETDETGQLIKRQVTFDLRYQAILIISIMIKYDYNWLVSRRQLVDNLQQIWTSEEFHQKHNKIESTDYTHWKEPKLLVHCLLNYFQNQTAGGNKEVIELLFQLLRLFMGRYLCDFEFFRLFLEKTVIETYSIEWKRDAFAKFVNVFHDPNYPQKLKAKILQYIIIPSFSHSFEKGLGEALLGGPPLPERENPNNLIHMFINKVIDPICSGDKKFIVSDAVRILLLQFSCLLVDQASPHIHEATNRRQSSRLKKLVTLAWPCLLNRTGVDPAAKYHGHFLLSHIIAKFAVHKRIVIQVFHSLLKASTPDARLVVKQALDILLPAIPNRLEEGNSLLLKWTKKIIIEEGHTMNQLIHMLQLLVRHYRLYYPIRAHLIPLMINSIQRLGYTTGGTIENKKTAVDLCEVIMRWEMFRQKELRERQRIQSSTPNDIPSQPSNQTSNEVSPVAQQPASLVTPSSSDTLQSTADSEQAAKTDKVAAAALEDVKPDISKDSVSDSSAEIRNPDQSTYLAPLVPENKHADASPAEQTAAPVEQTVKQLVTSVDQPVTPVDQPVTTPEAPSSQPPQSSPASELQPISTDQTNSEDSQTDKKKPVIEDPLEALDPRHVDSILNALLRLACIVNPHADLPPSPAYTTCKNLSDRCITLIKKILIPELWGGSTIVAVGGPNLAFSSWMGDLLCSVQNQNCTIGSVSGALELLTYLCGMIKREAMLVSLKNLSNGIIACTKSPHSRIIRSVSNLVQRVMNVFPTQPSTTAGSSASAPHEELEFLYNSINQVIMSGLNLYEQIQIRPPEPQPSNPRERDNWQVPLFSSLMLLKAACINNPTYIDRVMPTLIRVIQKMTREHINHMIETTQMSIELLILGLDLVKNRLGTMSPDLRKQFIQQILSNLIESPTSDVKVLKAVVRIVEEWMKQKQIPPTQGPNLREKTLLLIKLMLFIEKRFPTEPELNSQFLELIYYVYRDDELKATDLTTKLESAFMAGLRCVQPQIRAKFFQIYDQSVKPKLYERLMYIVCAQNWQQIGCHFWIQQCIEFILSIALAELPINSVDTAGCLPCVPTTADLGTYNPSEYDESPSSLLSMLSNDFNTVVPPSEDIEFVANHDQLDDLLGFMRKPKTLEDLTARKNLQIMVNRQVNFLEDLKKTRTGDLLRSLTQLCHMSVDLAKTTWINMFPRIWRVLNDQQMTLLGREIIPFLCSGAHVYQRDCNPSAVGAFMEAVSRCQPPIHMRPILIKYLGKNHNIWHRSALMLEDCTKDKSLDTIYPIPARSNKANQQNQQDFDIVTVNPKVTLAEEAVESISDILELLREDDLWSGLWQRKAQYEETKQAVLCEQQGLFSQAQEYYESAMNKQRREFDNTYILKPGMKSENRVWEKHWIRCTKELNQWDSLLDYGSSKACTNPMLVLESAWRVPNWAMMKEALILVEDNCPASLMWRLHLYKGYNYICNHEDVTALQMVDESFHLATSYCIQTWKKLPHIITNAHIPLLQAAQQLLELNEAKSLHLSLYGVNRNGIHELRTILKAWPKRVPILLDDLSYWSDILTWRQHQYQTIVAHFESQAVNQAACQVAMGHSGPVCMTDGPASVAMQGAHFSAQGIISFGTVARKQGLLNVCLDAINRIHTIPSVPIFDCYQKIRQQIKCYLQMPISPDKSELLDGIDIIECTNLKYFQKEYVSEFYTYKGIFLARLGRHDESNKAFSAAAQLNDSAPKAWSAWGDYLETRFTQDFTQTYEGFSINSANFANRQMDLGVSAITCYLQACKFYNESKARKYLARVLWLLSFDNTKGDLVELINKYSGPTRDSCIPPSNWIVWIPQILQCLMLNPEADALRNLLVTIGKHSPQAVYFPVRTLHLTLRVVFAGHSQKMRTSMQPTSLTNQSRLPQMASNPSSDASGGDPPTPLPPHQGASPSGMVPSPVQVLSPSSQTKQQSSTPKPPMSPYQQSGSPSTSNAASQQSTLVQQLQQPPALLASQAKSIPSPGCPNMHPQSPQSKAVKMRAKTVARCSEIVKRLHEAHPTTISSLEGITDQMIWLRDYSYEEVQRQIHQALTKCYISAFENVSNIAEQTVSPQTLNFVRKLVTTFGVGLSSNLQGSNTARCGYYNTTMDYLNQRSQAIIQDPEFQQTRVKFRADFEESLLPNMKLIALIAKLKHWIGVLGQKKKLMPKSFLMEDKCRFLSNFSQHTADVEIPGDALMPKLTIYYVRIARFIPEVRVVDKHNTSARRILIRGHNGKIYPYLVLNDSCLSDSRREERVSQMLRLLNQYLVNKKETGRRFLQFTVPRVVAISPGLRLVEDNPSSLSLIDILKRRINHNRSTCCNMDQDSPIAEYYDRLIKLQTQNIPATQKHLRDILADIQSKIVPKTMLKEWACQTYVNATDYWVFRSQFTYQLAMACLCEYAFHFTRLMPETMYIHQDTGQINVSFFKFDLDDSNGELRSNRPVPFRLTPNLSEFITPTGIVGPFRGALDAISHCLTNPQSRVMAIFRAILRDEMLFWQKRGQDTIESETLVNMVNKAINKIYQRLNSIASDDRMFESQTPQLVNQATSLDLLSQMDPAWHPWL